MTNENTNEEKKELEPIVGHLVVQDDPVKFLDKTTQAIKNYTKQGYEVETHYQTTVDPKAGSIITHSAYLVGKLKETKPETPELVTVHIPHVNQEALSKVEEWVESHMATGYMPNGIYNTIMDLIDSAK
ncbi:radical SAM domain-containing protein [Bacillus phage Bcp1]|uniref:Radical SAM domain protein-like protein n=1 Tax=Bacillus phage Bcp1 TaxID=584892 RepID=X2JMM1_9CAUD|nr:radical SAM domain-containing protein [Bacillus phage Bcp1]AHN66487.1 radical SAM domain protein-like protein [Bacillus phage Bcp1]